MADKKNEKKEVKRDPNAKHHDSMTMEHCVQEVLHHADHLHALSTAIVDTLGTIEAAARHNHRHKHDSPHINSDDARLLVQARNEKDGAKFKIHVAGEDFNCEKVKGDIFGQGSKHHLALFPEDGGRFFIIVVGNQSMRDDKFEKELAGVFNKFKNVLNPDKDTVEHEHLVADMEK